MPWIELMARAHNFSAGPAAMPEAVLERARDELLDWQGNGASVMELSHRGSAFMAAAARIEADLRSLLAVPDEYAVLFMQGGASQHFVQVPMNLAVGGSVDFVVTGHWSEKTARESAKLCRTRIAASAADSGFRGIPAPETWQLDPQASYLHLTPNETIHGVEFHQLPETGAVPIVADMSSTLLSRPIDVGRYGLIYACAQKNFGPSGLVLIIVRRDLLARCPDTLPDVLRYDRHAEQGSLLNTPPTFAWYMAGLVFEWLLENGGLTAMAERNQAKAQTLYAAIDGSGGYYRNTVEPAARSWMNIPFQLHDPALDSHFLEQAQAAGLIGLKGHRVVGGMRASLYNAVSMTSVQTLIQFMTEFARRH